MPKPPEDVTAEELFLKLTEPRPSAVIDWPAKEKVRPKDRPARARVFVLPGAEHERAAIEGKARVKRKFNLKDEEMRDPAIAALVGDAAAREIIAASCHHERPILGTEDQEGGPRYPRLFRDSDHVNQLTAHEIAVLFRAYELVQERFGPYEGGGMDPEESELWLKRLQEGGSAFPLLSLPLPQLVALSSSWGERLCSLCAVLASQWESLPNTLRSDLQGYYVDTSSFGKPVSDPDPNSSEKSADVEDPLFVPDEVLDVDDAKAFAERMRKGQ